MGDHLPRGVKAQRGNIFLPGAFRSMRAGRFCAPGHGSGDMFRRREELRHAPPPASPYSLLLLVSPVPLRLLSSSSAGQGSSGAPPRSLPVLRGLLPGARGGMRQTASEGAPGEWAGRGKAADWHRAGEFREPSGGSGRDSEQKPWGGAHHSPSGTDWCGRGLRGPERAEGRGRDLGEEGPA